MGAVEDGGRSGHPFNGGRERGCRDYDHIGSKNESKLPHTHRISENLKTIQLFCPKFHYGAWKVKKGFNFHKISSNLFSFQFSDVLEKERILNSGPWPFDRSLLVLREPGTEQLLKMSFDIVSFWVCMYDLSIGVIRETTNMLVARIGQIIKIDEGTILVLGKFIRLRVAININKTLRRGLMISLERKKLWVVLKYERLPKLRKPDNIP